MRIKTIFNMFVTLSLLALGPKDNRNFLFRTPGDHFYGEVPVYLDGQSQWSIAKNSGEKKVAIPIGTSASVYTRDINDGSQHLTANEIKAQTLALVHRTNIANDADIIVEFDHRNPREPRRLQVATEADMFYMFIWPIILLGLAVGLTFLINDYSWQCDTPPRDLIESDE